MVRTDAPRVTASWTVKKDSEGRPTGVIQCDDCGAEARCLEDIRHAQTCRYFKSRWDGLDVWESERVRDLARGHAVRDEPDCE